MELGPVIDIKSRDTNPVPGELSGAEELEMAFHVVNPSSGAGDLVNIGDCMTEDTDSNSGNVSLNLVLDFDNPDSDVFDDASINQELDVNLELGSAEVTVLAKAREL